MTAEARVHFAFCSWSATWITRRSCGSPSGQSLRECSLQHPATAPALLYLGVHAGVRKQSRFRGNEVKSWVAM